MKKFFFTLCALAAIVSCSKSEVINAPGADQAIAFDSYFGNAATKATAYEIDNLRTEGFDVVAFTHANGVAADYNTVWKTFELAYANGSWGYGEVPVYWPSNGDQVDFFTFPTVDGVTVNEAKTGFTFAVKETVTEQVDLVAAKAALNKTVTDGAVKFEFKHLLSRVAFVLTNTGTSAITVSSVKLYGDFYKQGTVDLTDETLAIETSETDAKPVESVKFDGEAEATSMAAYELLPVGTSFTGAGYIYSGVEANKYMMLIPATAKGISVTYTIADDNTVYNVTKKFATEVALAASSAYKFTFKVSTDAIEFEVVGDLAWGAESDATESITL